MSNDLVNADFSQRVVLATDALPWLASPQAGVQRRMLDRIGGEVARATSLVRYAPDSVFPTHAHGLGEEFLVLDGTFSDEHGDYPAGTYVRNPPGSRHAPRTEAGCTILVKLRQMPTAEQRRVVIDTRASDWPRGEADGHARLVLHAAGEGGALGEVVTIERLEPGVRLAASDCPGGEEIFILSGDLADERGGYGGHTWIRNPAGLRRSLTSQGGAVYWAKRGHLSAMHLPAPP